MNPEIKKDKRGEERRKYIRLDSVFPVEFRLLSPDKQRLLSDWLQGFTNNLSKGGICLAVNNLAEGLAALLKNQQAKLSLKIGIPVSRKPVQALARVAWAKETAPGTNNYLVGLAYEEIAPAENSRIMRSAWAKKLFVPTALILIIILSAGFIADRYINLQLIRSNKALVGRLVRVIQETSAAKQKISAINREREELEANIRDLQACITMASREKEILAAQLKSEGQKGAQQIEELSVMLGKLSREKSVLQQDLAKLKHQEGIATEELRRLDQDKVILEQANLDKMYQWLKIHQNPRTGLVMSFEGDSDISGWAFTYDQALLIQAYARFQDAERARKILDFFSKRAQRSARMFFNAYYADDGSPAEFTVHSGPNIWLGIAIAQYTRKTGDRNYLNLAEEIASGVIALQNEDPDGGVRGGPQTAWYSTEHNLDAYAFFNLLYKITAKEYYARARDKVLNWLLRHTYDKAEIPVKRAKGDSTIATDTYAWSIAAIGPEKLAEIGMDADKIIEFAEQNCAVEVSYLRPEGQSVKVKGFDFAPQRHVARGSVVSSEWTAQMVISFKIMADYYRRKNMEAKAAAYAQKASAYLGQLGRMIISSPSPSGQGESCLAYATQDFVDTGHGWMTPKGKSTGSVAGTVYTIFAYYNYNPLGPAE